jgi:GntR family transcriptional regulator/MocR family aminotransferase
MPGSRRSPVARWRPDPRSVKPLYRQVYERFRDAIRDATLKPGERLASARSLASQLGAARGTVDLAYSLLAAEGYIVSRGAAGTFVATGLNVGSRRSFKRPAASAGAPQQTPPAATLVAPFQMGVPALDVFPHALWSRLSARHARMLTVETLVGADPSGYAPLRAAVASYLTLSRGIRCGAGQVIVTPGFQGALALLVRVFLQPGAQVCFEEPGYFFARQALEAMDTPVVPVPVDSEGLDVDQIPIRAAQSRVVYTTPAHQAPLGVSLTLQRRLALLSWAEKSGAWIIEDDYDSEFRYGSRPLPALKSLDEAGRVLYVGTFSKVLFPGLRLGYLVVPETEVDRVRQVGALMFRGVPLFGQAVVADFIAEGHFARHIRRMRTLYEQRRAALANALAEVFRDRLTVELQAGGMHLIGRTAPVEDDVDIVARARAHGLAPAALSRWYADRRRSEQGLLLSFTNVSTTDATEAAMRLRRAIARTRFRVPIA